MEITMEPYRLQLSVTTLYQSYPLARACGKFQQAMPSA